MEIKYIGHSSFLIRSKGVKAVTDPYDSKMVGLPYPKTEADVVTVSHHHADHDQTDRIEGAQIIIDWPGEYEVKGLRIFGFGTYHDKQQGAQRGENVMYKFEIEDMGVLHCGDLGHLLDDSVIDAIGNVDILMIPVGGIYTINPAEARAVTHKLDPSLVLPMHYKHDKLNQENFGTLATVDEYIQELGVEKPQLVDKLVVKKEDLKEETSVVLFTV